MKNVLFSLLTFLVPFFASGQPMSSVDFFPEKWAIPSMDNISEDSGWNFLIQGGNDKPYYVSGDFNGDNLMDEAWLLMRTDIEVWGFFVFLNDSAGNYKRYLLGGMGDVVGNNPKNLARCKIIDCFIYAIDDEISLCQYDQNFNLIEQKDSEFDLLGFGVYEVGGIQLFHYNKQEDAFEMWWDCNADED